MARDKIIYICDSCGNETLRWQGQCPACGEWNSLKEVKSIKGTGSRAENRKIIRPEPLDRIKFSQGNRLKTKISEFDRVLGGGFIKGSVVLLAGEPGIGKSTLLLQVAAKISGKVLYLSGEESEEQIKIRSKRIINKGENIDILPSQNLADLFAVPVNSYSLIIIDSIQTIVDTTIDGQPGGIAQVKGSAHQLKNLAKEKGVPIVLAGQITKEGRVAGPKTLEHLVDTVCYLEGDKYHDQRIIRTIKNRFGSTGEAGIFKMTRAGLEEVTNPSALFLEQRAANAGSAVTVIVEGQRPLLIEVQALTERTVFGYPKRRTQGVTLNRLEMLAAVLSKRAGVNLADKDIYVNIIGGLSTQEPAIDLAIGLAITSSVADQPIADDLVLLGEIGLSGEIRMVNDIERRLREAKKLGFKKALIPPLRERKFVSKQIEIKEVSTLKEAIRITGKS